MDQTTAQSAAQARARPANPALLAPVAVAAMALLMGFGGVAAQSPTTEWTAYTSMRHINGLLRHDGDVWVCTSGGVLRYDEEAQTYTRFTRLDGLAGNQVLSTAVDLNGNLWFGTDGRGLSRYRPDTDSFDAPFVEFENRRIWALLSFGTRLYVGTDQGVSVFRIDREEVKETYRKLGNLPKDSPVVSLALSGGILFAGTRDGVSWAELNQPNLQDPDSWRTAVNPGRVAGLLATPGTVVAASQLGAYSYDRQQDLFVAEYREEPTTAVGSLDGRPVIAAESGNYFRRDGPGEWTRVPGPIIPKATAMSRSGSDLWIGTETGIRVIQGPPPPPSPEPAANRFYEMELLDNGEFWVASTPNDQQDAYGVSRLAAEGWAVYDKAGGMPLDELVALESDPLGRLWVGTWGAGAVVRGSSGTWLPVTPDSSPLMGLPGAPAFVVISDIQRDGGGNMWLVNVLAGIAVMDGFPARQGYLIEQADLGLGSQVDLNKLAIGGDGTKWISSRTDGLIVLDDGGTPFTGGDDTALLVNRAYDGRLSSNRTFDVTIDVEQTVWLATDAGLNAIRATWDRTAGRLVVDDWRVYTLLDGLPSNEINAVEGDADGNMWVATESGLSQIGRDGEVSFTLTEANSGLASNRVTSLLFDARSSELWIGTFNGLNRLVVQQGHEEQPSGLTVYPNPYASWAGPMTFAGLPLGASLAIYTIDGLPVIRVAGVPGQGTLTWSGQNEAGFLVGSGVYLYVADDEDGNSVSGRFAVMAGPGAP